MALPDTFQSESFHLSLFCIKHTPLSFNIILNMNMS